jgi:4-hydroxy-4-methyl-2-oxoglutarate aldolase
MSVEHPNNGRAAGRIIDTADLELFEYIEKSLYTAVLSDALDEMGLQEQAMRETIRPLSPGYVLAGWARTISSMDVWTSITPSRIPTTSKLKPWTAWLPGEIAVVATGDSKRNAPWGELLSTAALSRGARGAVIDCLVRDVKKIQALGFPVFAAGIKPVDSPGARGRG